MLNTPKYSGEPTPQALASGLATLGRYGDEFMVHAAEGETVIPPEIFEANPQLKADLFRQMAMMGIKDPNRYVVGNSLNSINPLTGQPEFFFKKIFKSIKKVFKKALPIIAPILGNLILPGWGGMIASGLVTKLQGGSWGDALKGAAITGIASLATGGLSGAMSGGTGGISSGMTDAFANPFSAASYGTGWNPLSGEMPLNASGTQTSLSNLTGTPAPAAGTLSGMGPDAIMGPGGGMSAAAPTTLTSGIASVGTVPDVTELSRAASMGIDDFVGSEAFAPTVKLPTYTPAANADGIPFDAGDFGPVSNEAINANFEGAGLNTTVESSLNPQQGFIGDTADYVGEKGQDFLDYVNPSEKAAETRRFGKLEDFQKNTAADYFKVEGSQIPEADLKTASKTWLAKNPREGVFRRFAPATALTAAAYSAYDAYSEEEAAFNAKSNKPALETIAYDKWREVKDKDSPEAQEYFKVWNGPAYITRKKYEKQTGGPSIWQDWRFLPEGSESYAGYDQTMGKTVGLLPADLRKNREEEVGSDAQGPFPGYKIGQLRAMGGEVVGPGTGTSDSIPARLSDGEFVMTADAVRNAGGGSRDLGAARMYDMMRRFEGGVA